MGVVTSTLPTMATMVLEMTALPLAMSMWFYSKSLLSWALATALIVVWEAAISIAFNVHNPMSGLVGQELADAQIIFGVLCILCLAASLVGSTTCYFLDLCDVIPFPALIPLSSSETTYDLVPQRDQPYDNDGNPLP